MSLTHDTRFSTLATIDGRYEVVDGDGRTVDIRDSRAQANGVAFKLNNAVAAGPSALVAALGGSRPRNASYA
jgi:hypothetical protein